MDHQMNNAAIFRCLHEKMPHHSAQSWQAYIKRVLPDELDNIRKKVGIARRKAADSGSNSRTNQWDHVQNEAGPSNKAKHNPLAAEEGIQVTPKDQDFQIICQFFASGGGDNSDDEAVWESLAALQPCRSAPSWPEYYQGREDKIMEEIERLIEEAETGIHINTGSRKVLLM